MRAATAGRLAQNAMLAANRFHIADRPIPGRIAAHAVQALRHRRAAWQGSERALKASALPPRHEGELLEEVHVLLVLEEGAVQRRDELARVALAQLLGADVLREQQLQPVEELGGGGLLLQPRHLADLEEDAQRLLDEAALDARIV